LYSFVHYALLKTVVRFSVSFEVLLSSFLWVVSMPSCIFILFVLGHALYLKAIHGGKTKNDKIDSFKIAALLKGGNLPVASPFTGSGVLPRHPSLIAFLNQRILYIFTMAVTESPVTSPYCAAELPSVCLNAVDNCLFCTPCQQRPQDSLTQIWGLSISPWPGLSTW
jgi:hypothetical protein